MQAELKRMLSARRFSVYHGHHPNSTAITRSHLIESAMNHDDANRSTQIDSPTIDVQGTPPPTEEENRLRWAAWYRAMELSHEMLMQGLRQRVGPDGDVKAAYRAWYMEYQSLKWEANRAP